MPRRALCFPGPAAIARAGPRSLSGCPARGTCSPEPNARQGRCGHLVSWACTPRRRAAAGTGITRCETANAAVPRQAGRWLPPAPAGRPADQPEQLPVRGPRLDHPVGVQQHRVIGLQLADARLGAAAAEPERQCRVTAELGDHLAAAQQQWRRAPGTGPLQPSRPGGQPGDDAGGERIIAVIPGQRLIDGRVDTGDRCPVPAGVPAGPATRPGLAGTTSAQGSSATPKDPGQLGLYAAAAGRCRDRDNPLRDSERRGNVSPWPRQRG